MLNKSGGLAAKNLTPRRWKYRIYVWLSHLFLNLLWNFSIFVIKGYVFLSLISTQALESSFLVELNGSPSCSSVGIQNRVYAVGYVPSGTAVFSNFKLGK